MMNGRRAQRSNDATPAIRRPRRPGSTLMKGCPNTTPTDPHDTACTGSPHVIGARADALRIGYKLRVDPGTLTRLDRARALARAGGASMTIAGETFGVERRGRRGKPFALVNLDGRVFIGERAVDVDLAVPFLAARSVAAAVAHADRIARGFCAPGRDIEAAEVRELDLCADLAGATFREADRDAFVGRLREGRTWETDFKRTGKGARFTGLRIGARPELSFTVYDKTVEIRERHGADDRSALEHGLWTAQGWDGQGTVWRAEFKPRGRVLTEYGLRDPTTLPDRIDGAWQAFTRKTLRLVTLGAATRRERCPTDPRWEALQGVSFAHADVPAAKRIRRASGGVTVAQAVGTMLSLFASSAVPRETAESIVRSYLAALNSRGTPGAKEQIAALPARLDAAWARRRGVE